MLSTLVLIAQTRGGGKAQNRENFKVCFYRGEDWIDVRIGVEIVVPFDDERSFVDSVSVCLGFWINVKWPICGYVIKFLCRQHG
jgi:hypothetical protein